MTATPRTAAGLEADLMNRLTQLGPTVTITKAQAAWLLERIRLAVATPSEGLRAALERLRADLSRPEIGPSVVIGTEILRELLAALGESEEKENT